MSRPTPVRTCAGCRERAAKPDLVRLVVDAEGPQGVVVLDERGTRPGRGAHLHPTLNCLDLAVRKRVFPRAFRLAGPLDVTAVRAMLEVDRPAATEAGSNDDSRKRSSGS